MFAPVASKASPSHQSLERISSSACSMALQHHHHFYSHALADASSGSHGHHLHHLHHFQLSGAAVASSSSVLSTASDSTLSSISSACCPANSDGTCRCSNRLLTGIVITILPIAITSTLICVFMMQKTNLHQYAIYSFVIFCVAFIFPFALFFFTVVLNKIYKFYKREIRSNPHLNSHLESYFPDSCDPESASTTGYNLQGTAGRALSTQTGHCPAGQSTSLLCYNSRNIPAYHPYYYAYYAPTETLSANMTVDSDIPTSAPTIAGETTAFSEESPPSYEMALMCPRVSHHQYPNSGFIQAPIQVILPTEQCNEKLALSANHKSPSLTSLAPTSQVMAANENQNKCDHGNGENAPHSSSSLEECKPLNCGPKVLIPIAHAIDT